MTADTTTALSGLAGDAANANRSEQEILKAAHDRRAVVEKTIAELRPKALSDQRSAELYQDAVTERGHLDLVISRSRAA